MSIVPEWNVGTLDLIWRQLTTIRTDLKQAERRAAHLLKDVHPAQRQSARNLIHYLALRQHDLRGLQDGLSSVGLSSLGRAEAHVLATIDSVLGILRRLLGKTAGTDRSTAHVSFEEGRSLLKRHAEQLLGRKPAPRFVRIMVTMPGEAADQPELVEQLLVAGMDYARINCAHDDSATWSQIVGHLRRAEARVGRNCRVLVDLAGPKIRTGPIEPGLSMIKWKPRRDVLGRVTEPARIWLTPADQPAPPPGPAAAVLPLPGEWLARLRVGDALQFEDLRRKKRALAVISTAGGSCWAEANKTAFIGPGTRLEVVRRSGAPGRFQLAPAKVGQIPPLEQSILLKAGDTLLLTASLKPGTAASRTARGRIRRPARIGCTAPEVFADVKAGEQVWFDDGKIGGVIESVRRERLKVRITHARSKGEKLRADKGINLPDTRLRLPALTAKDLADLGFLAGHADLAGYSFVQTPADVNALSAKLREIDGSRIGLVLKIETRQAFEQLPHLLLAAMRRPLVGVMIARGDLAVECGYERLAEVQEEILWICEAAHIPVVWATQVLESLARDGMPSRAEITDAAMGVRAECVMLNKGSQLVAAVRTLDNILCRMEMHQNKKTTMLRSLSLARSFNQA